MTIMYRALARALLAPVMALVLGTACLTAAAASEEEPKSEATYLKLHPDFVVNLTHDSTQPHFLLATIEVMSRDPAAVERTKHHLPAIRHELLLLLSEQAYVDVRKVAAREALRVSALDLVNGVLERETNERPIEGLYFTHFVVE